MNELCFRCWKILLRCVSLKKNLLFHVSFFFRDALFPTEVRRDGARGAARAQPRRHVLLRLQRDIAEGMAIPGHGRRPHQVRVLDHDVRARERHRRERDDGRMGTRLRCTRRLSDRRMQNQGTGLQNAERSFSGAGKHVCFVHFVSFWCWDVELGRKSRYGLQNAERSVLEQLRPTVTPTASPASRSGTTGPRTRSRSRRRHKSLTT